MCDKKYKFSLSLILVIKTSFAFNLFSFRRMMDCQSVTTPTENTGPHSAHLAWTERLRRPQARQCRAGTGRNCEQQCTRGDVSTGEATLPGRCAATGEGQTWLSPLQESPRKCVPCHTIAHHLCGEDDEPGSATFARQFWVCALFPSPSLGKCHTIMPVCSRTGRHQCRVNGELCSSVQWGEPIGHNLQSAVVNPTLWPQIQITDHYVRPCMGAFLPGGCTPFSQEPLPLRKLHGGGQDC